jgi:cysteine-S-conjugate beta-lyase
MKLQTRLLHLPKPDLPFNSLSGPIHRGTTITFDTVEEFSKRSKVYYDGYAYGLYAHPASKALCAAIAELEAGTRAVLTPSGMSALTLTNLSVLKTGDEMLLPCSAYGPARSEANAFLEPLGIRTVTYDPRQSIAPHLTSKTKLVWVESPGSFGMEIQDVPEIVAAAHAAGAEVASDGTWASPLGFRALDHGVDYAIQALSKHINGHSDVLMGSVAVKSENRYRRLRDCMRSLGLGVSPDDCFLTLRGLATLGARLKQQEETALVLAKWLAARPEVSAVLHPALPDDPGHAIWKRDFTSSGSLFSILLEPGPAENLAAFLEDMRVFRIGASWGGLHSLLAPADMQAMRGNSWTDTRPLVRLNAGLEDVADLLADLEEGLHRYKSGSRAAAE